MILHNNHEKHRGGLPNGRGRASPRRESDSNIKEKGDRSLPKINYYVAYEKIQTVNFRTKVRDLFRFRKWRYPADDCGPYRCKCLGGVEGIAAQQGQARGLLVATGPRDGDGEKGAPAWQPGHTGMGQTKGDTARAQGLVAQADQRVPEKEEGHPGLPRDHLQVDPGGQGGRGRPLQALPTQAQAPQETGGLR